ncbi:hypothetical protein HELRODRAFT_180221 [Helobdella robusta]|uniref:BTB domain-containing protein n=1 Tax=Helobdella robusta TaxID=6412 RepID=T1FFL1_HELRO|nr:hypothetical protein HELRODRAFT_180221 [Helobdella robusta]ESN94060.1 hypothetical protein HELRODRAFT_180221 [Helobdella robusta]
MLQPLIPLPISDQTTANNCSNDIFNECCDNGNKIVNINDDEAINNNDNIINDLIVDNNSSIIRCSSLAQYICGNNSSNNNTNHPVTTRMKQTTNLNNSHLVECCRVTEEAMADDDSCAADELSMKLWEYSYQMLIQQKHCDVVIVTQKGTIKAHRCILAFHSQYLCKVFYQLGADKKVVIRLDCIPIDTVRQMLCFFYSGEIKVNKFNLVDLLNVSEQYCFPNLQQACLDFFKDVTPENAIFLLSLTNSMGLETMQQNIMCFIVQSFNQVSQTPDFVYLPFPLLRCVLMDDDLQVCNELEVFYAVVRWVEHKKECRVEHVADLLNGPVRLELMSVEELNDEVESQDWMFCNQEAKDVLSEAYRKKLLMTSGLCPAAALRPRNYSNYYATNSQFCC